MNLCIISHAYVDTRQRDMLRLLAQSPDIELTLITPNKGKEFGNAPVAFQETNEPFRVIALKTRLTGHLNSFWYRSLRRTLRDIRPDLVQIEEEYWTNSARQCVRAAQHEVPHATIILQTCENRHRDWKKEGKTPYEQLRMRLFARIQKQVFTDVNAVFDQEWYITGNPETALIRHGYRGKRFAIPQLGVSEKRYAQQGTRAYNTPLRALFVGRMEHEKGGDIAIRAIGTLPPNTIELELIGNGPEREHWKALARTFPNHRISFLDAVPPDTLIEHYHRAHVLIVPSRTTPQWEEQFGRVIIEGIAASCVVVGAQSGSIPHLLPANSVFTENDPDDLAALLRTLVNDEHTYRNRLDAQRAMLPNYTNRVIAKLHLDAYHELQQPQ